jgi:hypothetical protein
VHAVAWPCTPAGAAGGEDTALQLVHLQLEAAEDGSLRVQLLPPASSAEGASGQGLSSEPDLHLLLPLRPNSEAEVTVLAPASRLSGSQIDNLLTELVEDQEGDQEGEQDG